MDFYSFLLFTFLNWYWDDWNGKRILKDWINNFSDGLFVHSELGKTGFSKPRTKKSVGFESLRNSGYTNVLTRGTPSILHHILLKCRKFIFSCSIISALHKFGDAENLIFPRIFFRKRFPDKKSYLYLYNTP